MPEPMGLVEFFAMEAGDYLDRLDALISRPGGPAEPDRAEFVRLARALRGAALMANQQAFAAAAAALERLARAVQAGQLAWDPMTSQLATRTVDDLKILVRKVTSWTEAESRKADQLAASLHEVLGGAALASPAPPKAAEGQRAVIAQRGAALAATLDQAAAALQHNSNAPAALQAVRQTILPLRGIAGLADFPPLPDLLDGIDRALAVITASNQAGPQTWELLSAAARAVSRAARDIAAHGRADAEAEEAREFVSRLNDLLGLGPDVVSIEALFYDDAGPHIVQAGRPPAHGARLGNLELVSHGEHLRQVADALERATSPLERELRAQALIGTFHHLASTGGDRLGAALAAFARTAREAVVRGEPSRRPNQFASNLRHAAAVLTAAGTESEEVLAERLDHVTAELEAAGTPPAAPAAATAPAPRRPPAPSAEIPQPAGEVLQAAAEAPVPAASAVRAAPAAARVEAVPAGEEATQFATAPAQQEEWPGLAGGYHRYERLVRELGLGPASLEELLAGPPALAVASTSPAVGPHERAQPGRAPAEAAQAAIVPISDLLYRGEAAFRRALSLREEVRALLAQASPDGQALRDLVEEVFDLIQLGIGSER